MISKQKKAVRLLVLVGIAVLPLLFSGCGYNRMVTLDEGVSAAWAQVENVYQRRMDLIPNLVETVKGYAAHEEETLTALTEARSRAGGVVNVDENLLNDRKPSNATSRPRTIWDPHCSGCSWLPRIIRI